MAGAYKDDEATRVDASILRNHQSKAPPSNGDDSAFAHLESEETARINLNEVDRRALPFKKQGGRRGDQIPEQGPEIPELAETGAMRPIQEPVMPFPDSNPSGAIPPSNPPPGAASNPPPGVAPSHPPPAVVESNPPPGQAMPTHAHATPKGAPTSLQPLHENPLAQSAWSQDGGGAPDPEALPSALAPAEPQKAAAEHPSPPDPMLRNVFFAAVVVIVAAAVLAIVL